MHVIARKTCLFILLFSAVLLASQFHYCCDLTATPAASHACPLCSVASSLVTAQSPSVEIIRVSDRLEIASSLVTLSSAVPRATSPRPPPAL